MSKHSEIEKKLRAHVIDDVTYSKTQVVFAYIGLFIGLWGFFIATVIILFCMTRGILGPALVIPQ